MQYPKEDIRRSILDAALSEFIEKGFQQASIRQIADKADVLPSNIYNYFKNKDKLFEEILKPILDKIENGKKFLYEREILTTKSQSFEEHMTIIDISIGFIEENWELLKILVFKSYGSSLSGYIDELLSWYTNFFKEYLALNQDSNIGQIDEITLHMMISIWYNSIREALMHDIRGERLKGTARDIMIFFYYGWSGLVFKKSKGKCNFLNDLF